MKKVIPENSILVPDNAESVFKGEIFEVYQWEQLLFDGSSATFEMLKRSDTVAVIAIVDDKLLVLDDEQPHAGRHTTFPAGRIDQEDDSTEAAAKREVLEETGYSFKNWRLVKVYQPYNKVEWFVYVYLAWEPAHKEEPKLDAGEKISVSHEDLPTVKQLIEDGRGSLGESRRLFKDINSIQDLINLPEFTGLAVDR